MGRNATDGYAAAIVSHHGLPICNAGQEMAAPLSRRKEKIMIRRPDTTGRELRSSPPQGRTQRPVAEDRRIVALDRVSAGSEDKVIFHNDF